MDVRVRFAPSPTGQVHIGNIRTAIFNWLYARHCKGKFLLRIEDTDLERSTKEAIDTLLECMAWLGLDYDEEIFYQSSRRDTHVKAAETMISKGMAYKVPMADGSASPIAFRIPWEPKGLSAVRDAGDAVIEVHPDIPVKIRNAGVSFAQTSSKGKPMEREACLAGFRQMKLYDANGNLVFELEKEIESVFNGKEFVFEKCSSIKFLRREVFYKDMIKGELSKPLDGMKDLIIVRSDSSPVFHLANVCDDIEQKITHIVRGDDHVENTYRHIFLFHALDYPVPEYAHLPMIVNQAGKPYSKRDGDAFVGDFREKGYLADALFNALTLLGWSPGDDREKLSRQEMIELFTLERVKSAPAQFDLNKLFNMNGLYLGEMSQDKFVAYAAEALAKTDWAVTADKEYFRKVAVLMQSRTKLISHALAWKYFFSDDYEYDMKALTKCFNKPEYIKAVSALPDFLSEAGDFTEQFTEAAIRKAEATASVDQGKLNQPVRVASTGTSVGAGVYETLALLGREKSVARIRKALTLLAEGTKNA